MKELLGFVVKTKCGDSFNAKIEHRGHWKPKRNLRIDIANRGKSCKNCVKKTIWVEEDGKLFKTKYLFCPAIGMLVSKNGKEVGYPLADDMI